MAEQTSMPMAVKKELSAIKSDVKEAKKVPDAVKENIKALKTGAKEAKKVRKVVKKQIKTLNSKVKKASSKSEKQDRDMEKLKADIESLKKKGLKKKSLSKYNLFMQRQLKQGYTFSQAVRLWKGLQKPAKNRRAVKVHRAGQKHNYSKSLEKIAENILAQKSGNSLHERSVLTTLIEKFEQSGSFGKVSASDEEVALSLAGLYFKEVARLGFKRSLEIDDVINAFYYALARIKRKDVESKEVMEVIKRAKSY